MQLMTIHEQLKNEVSDFVTNFDFLKSYSQGSAFAEQTDKSKLAIQKSLDKLEELKGALMHKYFG